ncbi:MAG: PD-(D/E)XK nuclease family protein, partial [Actinomycetota bacterium]|nr:PD-(D/E)XK nuclease family protein [Actinomycetota bacterium]
ADLLATALGDLADSGDSPLLDGVPDDVGRTMRRLAGLLRTARAAVVLPDGEAALWKLWSATGLQLQLTAASERGGRAGQRADAALDAVVGLFGSAADLAARLPGAGVRAFVDQVHGELLPGDPAARPARGGQSVTVLSAHAAKGLEWELVVVAGAGEGSWPDLRTRGGLLATEDLLDLAAGFDPKISRIPALLADERRLFYVACTRAGRQLLVTAVSGDERAPSRFLDELAGADGDPNQIEIAQGWPRNGAAPRRAFHLSELVGELRRTVISTTAEPAVVAEAARQLARLAEAGVAGAHPGQWYALAGHSTDAPAVAPGKPVSVSPSAVEALQQCALRGVLERRGARGPIGDPQMIGMVVHAAAHGLSQGMPEPAVVAEIDQFLAGQDQLPDWQLRRVRRAITSMTSAIAGWLQRSAAAGWQTIGSELAVDLPLVSDQANPVRMTGRIDHLARQQDGAVLVTDFKTGASMISVSEARQNLQLAAYQLALALDGVPGAQGAPAGAQLLYVRGGTGKLREQPALDAELAASTSAAVLAAAGRLAGADLLATENLRCDRCPVRFCCPLQSEGRQVTR